MMRGNCCQASWRYSSLAKASSISRRHSQVRRSMMPVDAAADTLQTPTLPVRNPAALGPQIGRQAHLGDRRTVDVEGETFDATGAEVPAGDDAIGGDVAQWFGHNRPRGFAFCLPSRDC